MDLLSIWRTVWRHRLALLPVVLLTVAGSVYVTFFVPSLYEATASYVLVNPPAPPTEAEIREDPSLAEVDTDNPFLRFDSSVVINIVSRRVSTDETRELLRDEGADIRYEVAPSARYGFASPIIDIRGVGDSPDEAIVTAEIAGRAVNDELLALQEAQGVNPTYMITTLPVEVPLDARERVSSRLRSLIAVVGLGGVLLFTVISVLQALDKRRAERAPKPGPTWQSTVDPVAPRPGGDRPPATVAARGVTSAPHVQAPRLPAPTDPADGSAADAATKAPATAAKPAGDAATDAADPGATADAEVAPVASPVSR